MRMSYDLMVFEKSKAPEGEKDFLSWYREQTEQVEEIWLTGRIWNYK